MISRRTFLKSAVIGSTGVAAALVGDDLRADGYSGTPRLEERKIVIPSLPSAFQGYRIGFLTDIHLGIWVPQSWIEHALTVLTQRGVDLLILGGDYIHISASRAWQTVGAVRNTDYDDLSRRDMAAKIYRDALTIFARFSFPDGTIGVVGNHEHWNFFPFFTETARAFPSLRFLINEEIEIRRGGQALSLYGVDDYVTGIPLLPPDRRREGNRARILVSHNPDYVAALLGLREDPFDFAMCGHTHGGQVRLPLLGGVLMQIRDNRFMSGPVVVGESTVYTSRGLGVVGLPFRFDCPPEITIFDLQQA